MDANCRSKRVAGKYQRSNLAQFGALALGMILGSMMEVVMAGPTGGEVIHGRGQIGQDGTTTSIDQLSQRMVLEWQTFDVAANENVLFNQPGTMAVALNRILDQNASEILGAIDANGRVFLINPNGIIFGETATVNVGALVASSLDLDYGDFMSGNYDFHTMADGSPGVIVNRGLLRAATGGSVTLMGGAVANDGLIMAELGQVTLASGNRAALDFDGDGLLFFDIDGEVLENALDLDAAVSNTGEISAQGGQVLLAASAARDVFANVVNNEGLIRAQRIDNTGGVIRLVGDGGNTVNSGVVDASGAGGAGGSIEILGTDVHLTDSAVVDASGDTSGGTVHIGGGRAGGDPALQNAANTVVDEGATISADAGQRGDGGEVIVWSDGTTRFGGRISAQGGSAGGNGGFAEVSGREHILVTGFADLRAAAGRDGELLIDPGTVIVCDAQPIICVQGSPDTFTDDFIVTQLGLGNFTIETQAASAGAENINFVDATSDITWANANTLTLISGVNITLDGIISAATGTLDLQFGADGAGGVLDLGNATVTVDTVTAAGGAGTDTIIGNPLANTWVVSAADSGTVTNANGSIDFSAVENLTGSTDVDTFTLSGGTLTGEVDGGAGGADELVGDNVANTFEVTGANSGTATGVGSFNRIEVLTGNADVDTFDLNGGTLSGAVNGGGGSDELIGDDVANAFEITGGDSGNATGVGSFANIENLTGGSDVDTFTLNGGTLTGAVDGAGGAADELDADNVANTFDITGANSGDATGVGSFANIENLTGGNQVDTFTLSGGTLTGEVDGAGGLNDELIGDNVANTFEVTGANSGNATGVGSFNRIENLTGNANTDTFDLNGGTLAGAVDGAGGANDELVGDDVANAFEVTGGNSGTATGVAGFANVENLTGGSNQDTFTLNGGTLSGTVDGAGGSADELVGDNVANTFEVTGANSGNATGVGDFANIENLTGNAGTDTFDLNGGTVSGAVDGAGGANDELIGDNVVNTFAITGANSGTATGVGSFANIENLTGGNLRDTFTLNGGTLSGAVDGAGSVNDELVGDNVANTFDVTGADSGDATGVGSFTRIENLTGNANNDDFVITGSLSGIMDGGAGGTDTADFSGVGGALTVRIDADGNGITNIDTVTGNGGNSTLVGGNTANTFNITGADSGDVGGTDFVDFTDLTGNADVDTFVLNGGTLSGDVDGAGGVDDELVGDNVANTFVVNGADSGTATGVGGFQNIENLTGNNQADTFTFTDALSGTASGGAQDDTFNLGDGGDAGVIDGGAQSTAAGDTVSFATRTLAVTIRLNEFADVETLQGTALEDTLRGTLGDDVFTVNAPDAGIAEGINFSSIENLEGLAGNDTFNLNSTLSGSVGVDGGDNGAAGDEIVGRGGVNTFVINAANSGTANGTAFSNVEDLTGRGSADSFTFTAALSGTASGGGQDDMFNLGDNGDAGVIDGGAEATAAGDTVSYAGRTTLVDVRLNMFTDVETMEGSPQEDTLRGTFLADTFTVNAQDAGIAGGINFSSFENLLGLGGDDTFIMNAGLTGSIGVSGGGNDAGGDEIVGQAASNVFVVSFDDEGTVNGTNFTEVENLTGQAAADTFTFSAVLTGTAAGGAEDDTFNLTVGGEAGVIDGGTQATLAGDIVSYAGRNTPVVIAVDRFVDVESVEGSPQVDTLQGTGADDTFSLSASNAGIASGLNFSDFENFEGRGGNDEFILPDGVVLTGTVDGGAGTDLLNLGAYTTTAATTLTGEGAIDGFDGDIAGIVPGFANIDALASGTAADDSLVGADLANTWDIDAAGGGTLSTAAGSLVFSGVESLTGGTAVDTFNLNTADFGGTAAGGDDDDVFNIGADQSGDLSGDAGDDRFVVADGAATTGTLDGGADTDTLDLSDYSSTVATTLDGEGATDGYDGSVAGIVGDFANIDALASGSAADDSLAGANLASAWDINAANAGTLTTAGGTLAFSGVENLDGSAADDDFTVSGTGSLGGTAAGAGGSNTLVANDTANTWDINAADSGSVTNADGSVAFTGIGDVTGGSQADTVTVSGTGSLSVGAAGAGGNNTLTGNDTANAWDITAAGTGTLSNADGAVAFADMGSIAGGSAADTFDLNAADFTGTVSGGGGDDVFFLGATQSAAISGNAGNDEFNIDVDQSVALRGGSGNDNFAIADGVVVTGTVDGGADVDGLTLSTYTTTVATTLDAEGAAGGYDGSIAGIVTDFDNIDAVVAGSAADDSLAGTDLATTWTITGPGGGGVASAGASLSFSNFENIDGGASSDTFDMNIADFAGTATGGGGADVFNIGANQTGNLSGDAGADSFVVGAGVSATGTLDGGAGTDVLDLSAYTSAITATLEAQGAIDGFDGSVAGVAPDFDNINGIVGGSAAGDRLNGLNSAATWRVEGNANNEYETGGRVLAFENFESLGGGSAADTFELGANAGPQAGNLTVTGAGGADQVNVVDNLDMNGNVTITGVERVMSSGGTLSGNVLTIDGASTGIGAEDDELLTDVDELSIDGAGDVFVAEANDLTVAGIDSSGDITVGSMGDMTISLVSGTGIVTLVVANGDIINGNGVADDNIQGSETFLTAELGLIGNDASPISINVPRIDDQATIHLISLGGSIRNPNFAIVDSTVPDIDQTSKAAAAAVGASVSSALEEIGFVDWAGLDPDVRLVDCLEPCIKLPPDQVESEELAKFRDATRILVIRTVAGLAIVPVVEQHVANRAAGEKDDSAYEVVLD